MGGGASELKGPDLKEDGIAASDIEEGGALLGHAEGEAVLLSRVDGEIVAISATCSHYGGPLADGIVVDGRVHCPWHHACFDLRTGEAVRPPALNPVDRWTVAESDGRVHVTGKASRQRPTRTPSVSPDSIAIIGGGAAGDAAAAVLRREGYDGPVVMFDPDEAAPYDRPNLSKDYLAGNAPEEWIPLRSPDYFAGNRIERIGARVTGLDTASLTVRWGDGEERRFGAILVATGAEPIRLPVSAADGARLFHLRSLADCRAIIDAVGTSRRVVVVGASFIGLEVAASLRARELEVHVVAPEAIPLERVMGSDLGGFVHDLHTKKGVTFHLGRTIASVAPDHVLLDDGTRLEADMVVAGIGVRPRTSIAQEAGLIVDDGIVVDEQLRTSAKGIWAAGDVARWPEPRLGTTVRIEHWVVAQRMGQAAARNILGAEAPFRAVPFFWSQHYDAAIAYVGHAPEWDQAELDGRPDDMDCAVTFRRGGQRLAVASIFRDELSLRTEVEMEREAGQDD
jgi:NADPH-dependent 2,4-dienoyl-CoA reductase/sulfur reductase-like enzyme/nitrite reductase/ring-hydroxylating ferredoxin subunit